MGGSKNATTTATQTLPSWVQSAYQGLFGNAQKTASTPYSPYTGGFTPDQQTAFTNIGNLAGSSAPAFGAANQNLNAAAVSPDQNVGRYMSPYNDAVIRATMGNMQEQNAQEQQGVVGNAIAKGAFGGNRVGVAQSELARQQDLANQSTIAGLYQSNYGQALSAAQQQQQANLAAGNAFGQLGATQMNTDLSQAGAQLGAGTQQQQFDYQQYLNKQGYPYQQQSWLASILGGLGPTAGGTTTQQTPQGNIWSQLLGAGLGIASLFGDGGVVPKHAAAGGIMGANDNGGTGWPGIAFGSTPYANDNAGFGAYIPKVASMGVARSNFPTIQQPGQQPDPLSQYSDVMNTGASHIKDWLFPKSALSGGLAIAHARGGEVSPRFGFASGGMPFSGPSNPDDPTDFGNYTLRDYPGDSFFAGILPPGHGHDSGAKLPPLSPKAAVEVPTVDTVNALDASRMGFGAGNGEATATVAAATPDDMGMNQPAQSPSFGTDMPTRAPQVMAVPSPSGGGSAVPFGSGDQFTTTPTPGYSQNIGDAWKSLSEGNGLNLSPDVKQALLAAGAGMMASKSPFALAGVGEGALKGIETWNARQDLERANANQRAANATTGAGLAQTAASIGQTQASTAQTRYSATYTPAGVQVFDFEDPGHPKFVPWGQVLPDGTVANPAMANAAGGPRKLFSTDAPKMATDPRLMSPQTVPLAVDESAAALADARPKQQAAIQTNQQFEELRHDLDALPSQGLLVPGSDFTTRVDLAKKYNTALTMAGMGDYQLDTNAVAAGEDLNKLTTRLGFGLSQTLGSREAASIVEDSISAVPGGANSKAGAQRVINGLEAVNKRAIDYYNFLQKWQGNNSGSIKGADEYFNMANPPELYALSAYVPLAAMEYLQAHPDTASIFNQKYGNGRNVAKYVLGQ